MKRFFPQAPWFVIVMLVASRAEAQDAAEACILRGVEQRERGDDLGALATFTGCWERDHSPRAEGQMALAEFALGRWMDAEAHLAEALSSNDAWIATHRDLLDRQLEAIRRHIGTLQVRNQTPRAELWIDGRRFGPLPLSSPARLPEGQVAIEVRAPRCQTHRDTVVVRGGEATTKEVLRLRCDQPRHPLGLILAGVGAASAITGAALWGVAGAMCDPNAPGCRTRDSAAIGRLDAASNALGWGGLALMAAGAAMWLLRFPSAGEEAPVRASVMLGPGALHVVGSF